MIIRKEDTQDTLDNSLEIVNIKINKNKKII